MQAQCLFAVLLSCPCHYGNGRRQCCGIWSDVTYPFGSQYWHQNGGSADVTWSSSTAKLDVWAGHWRPDLSGGGAPQSSKAWCNWRPCRGYAFKVWWSGVASQCRQALSWWTVLEVLGHLLWWWRWLSKTTGGKSTTCGYAYCTDSSRRSWRAKATWDVSRHMDGHLTDETACHVLVGGHLLGDSESGLQHPLCFECWLCGRTMDSCGVGTALCHRFAGEGQLWIGAGRRFQWLWGRSFCNCWQWFGKRVIQAKAHKGCLGSAAFSFAAATQDAWFVLPWRWSARRWGASSESPSLDRCDQVHLFQVSAEEAHQTAHSHKP